MRNPREVQALADHYLVCATATLCSHSACFSVLQKGIQQMEHGVEFRRNFFAGQSPSSEFALEFFARMTIDCVSARAVVVEQSDACDRFFVLLSGSASVLTSADNIHDSFLFQLEPGGFFGELGLLESSCYGATVVANTPCEFGVLDRRFDVGFLVA